MHAFMKPRVTLNAVGALSCQLDALKYVTSFEHNKAPTLQSGKSNTHIWQSTHAHTSRNPRTRPCVQDPAIMRRRAGYIKIERGGVSNKSCQFSWIRQGSYSQCGVSSLRHSHLTDDTQQRMAKYWFSPSPSVHN